jgi:hypothetical protein
MVFDDTLCLIKSQQGAILLTMTPDHQGIVNVPMSDIRRVCNTMSAEDGVLDFSLGNESYPIIRGPGMAQSSPGRVVTSVAVPGRDSSDVAALEQCDYAFSQVPDRHKCLVELVPSHHQTNGLSDTCYTPMDHGDDSACPTSALRTLLLRASPSSPANSINGRTYSIS